jgi:hypothetical protein
MHRLAQRPIGPIDPAGYPPRPETFRSTADLPTPDADADFLAIVAYCGYLPRSELLLAAEDDNELLDCKQRAVYAASRHHCINCERQCTLRPTRPLPGRETIERHYCTEGCDEALYCCGTCQYQDELQHAYACRISRSGRWHAAMQPRVGRHLEGLTARILAQTENLPSPPLSERQRRTQIAQAHYLVTWLTHIECETPNGDDVFGVYYRQPNGHSDVENLAAAAGRADTGPELLRTLRALMHEAIGLNLVGPLRTRRAAPALAARAGTTLDLVITPLFGANYAFHRTQE